MGYCRFKVNEYCTKKFQTVYFKFAFVITVLKTRSNISVSYYIYAVEETYVLKFVGNGKRQREI